MIKITNLLFEQYFVFKIFLFSFFFSLIVFQAFSQNIGVGINSAGAPPNANALLDVDAAGITPKMGVLVTRMNTADRNAISPPIPESLLIYNTDSHCFEAYYNGSWVAWGCLSSPSSCGNPITDSRDGQTYNTVPIGNQCWMAQNLNYGTFISETATPQQQGYKFCQNLNGIADDSCPMGGLYEWANMMNGSLSCEGTCTSGDGLCDGSGDHQICTSPVQGLCPDGWHIPSHYEWTLLEQNVCVQNPPGTNCSSYFPYNETLIGWQGTTEGGKMKLNITCGVFPCWNSPNVGATNSANFTALPAGEAISGTFGGVGTVDYWWTSTEFASVPTSAWRHAVHTTDAKSYRINAGKTGGYSVRCVKN